jgi:alpha-L-glutamate ligase-like protein
MLWEAIKPEDSSNVIAVLRTIYQYTSGLDALPLQGSVDTLTSFRLGAVDPLGKSRLFVALTRMNGLPARVVGGVVLNENSSDIEHSWVEVNIDNQWVPFDPTEKYFASLPANYLETHVGDVQPVEHSAGIGFSLTQTVVSELAAPAIHPLLMDEINAPKINLATVLDSLQIPKTMIGISLLLPLSALLISFLRNVIGVKSFGVFMPMLIGAACSLVGLGAGLLGFVLVVAVAFLAHLALAPLKLLKIPRLAAVLTMVTLASFSMLSLLNQAVGMSFGMLALFPLVIISFVADKLHDLADDSEWRELVTTALGTMLSILLCYLVLQSELLQGAFALNPEFFLLVIAAQINLGRWTGIRLSEMFRFSGLISESQNLLGINARNRELVYAVNPTKALRVAADKLETKARLRSINVPVPETLAVFNGYAGINALSLIFGKQTGFVIKPNCGSQGKGITVIESRFGDKYLTPGGIALSIDDLKNHILAIINGQYSQSGDSDTAFIEPLIQQPRELSSLAPYGLADIRLIVIDREIRSAMLRFPTVASRGKANLHQGAIGAAICLESGKITRCSRKGRHLDFHPDSHKKITGFNIPDWRGIKAIARACANVIDLGYMGVDICIDVKRGPIVLEVNGRPGLEIQNVQNLGLKNVFRPAARVTHA